MYEKLHKKLKLTHHSHSGSVIPHHHTSWGILVTLLLFLGVILFFSTKLAYAGQQTQQSSLTLSGDVKGPPPSAPVIVYPADGASFNSSQIEVRGTCPSGNIMVEVFKNDIFAGAAACQSGDFKLKIELVGGLNKLKARAVDNFDQSSPYSNVVSVYFTPLTPSGQPAPSPVKPGLLVTSQSLYYGVLEGKELRLDINITGGQLPYAVHVSWGDGEESLIPQTSEGKLSLTHTYHSAAFYAIIIKVTDSAGATAYLQTGVYIASNTPKSIIAQAQNIIDYIPPSLIVAWPVFIVLLTITSSFWLGEKFELWQLSRTHKTIDAARKL